jgi:hypothetical protein
MLNYKVIALLIIAVTANLRNLETVTASPNMHMADYVKEFSFTGTINATDNTTMFANATYTSDDTATLSNECSEYSGFVAHFGWTNSPNSTADMSDVKFCLNVKS